MRATTEPEVLLVSKGLFQQVLPMAIMETGNVVKPERSGDAAAISAVTTAP